MSEAFTWDEVQALLTAEDLRGIEAGRAPDFLADATQGPQRLRAGLLGRARDKATAKAFQAGREVATAFGNLLNPPGLPKQQRAVLATIAYANYRTIRDIHDAQGLKQVLPTIEKIIAAGLEESARITATSPGAFATPESVGALCWTTSETTGGIVNVIHGAHAAWELYFAVGTAGTSLLALPVTVTLHMFLVGTLTEVLTGMAELYGCTSYLTRCGVENPARRSLELISSTTSSLENLVLGMQAVRDWTGAPVDPARQIARGWLAKSAGAGVPILGTKMHKERRTALVQALQSLALQPVSTSELLAFDTDGSTDVGPSQRPVGRHRRSDDEPTVQCPGARHIDRPHIGPAGAMS